MKRDLNFDLNLMPIIDILSVLISFLLLTAVWVEMGSIDVKQALGDNSFSGAKNPPSIWASFAQDGSVQLSLRDINSKMQTEYTIRSRNQQVDWSSLNQTLTSLKTRLPDLKTAIVRPTATTSYNDVIKIMDSLKKSQVTDLGLSPMG